MSVCCRYLADLYTVYRPTGDSKDPCCSQEAHRCADFESRRDEIIKELVEAAETTGFFTLVDHGISIEEINAQFALSREYFNLPQEVKCKIPHDIKTNNGWEYKVRNNY